VAAGYRPPGTTNRSCRCRHPRHPAPGRARRRCRNPTAPHHFGEPRAAPGGTDRRSARSADTRHLSVATTHQHLVEELVAEPDVGEGAPVSVQALNVELEMDTLAVEHRRREERGCRPVAPYRLRRIDRLWRVDPDQPNVEDLAAQPCLDRVAVDHSHDRRQSPGDPALDFDRLGGLGGRDSSRQGRRQSAQCAAEDRTRSSPRGSARRGWGEPGASTPQAAPRTVRCIGVPPRSRRPCKPPGSARQTRNAMATMATSPPSNPPSHAIGNTIEFPTDHPVATPVPPQPTPKHSRLPLRGMVVAVDRLHRPHRPPSRGACRRSSPWARPCLCPPRQYNYGFVWTGVIARLFASGRRAVGRYPAVPDREERGTGEVERIAMSRLNQGRRQW
jgi:hypothetical protein